MLCALLHGVDFRAKPLTLHAHLIALRQGKSYRYWDYRLGPPLNAEMKQMLEIAHAVRTFS